MPRKQTEGQDQDPKKQDTRAVERRHRRELLQILGKPCNFHRVQVRHLWEDRF